MCHIDMSKKIIGITKTLKDRVRKEDTDNDRQEKKVWSRKGKIEKRWVKGKEERRKKVWKKERKKKRKKKERKKNNEKTKKNWDGKINKQIKKERMKERKIDKNTKRCVEK